MNNNNRLLKSIIEMDDGLTSIERAAEFNDALPDAEFRKHFLIVAIGWSWRKLRHVLTFSTTSFIETKQTLSLLTFRIQFNSVDFAFISY